MLFGTNWPTVSRRLEVSRKKKPTHKGTVVATMPAPVQRSRKWRSVERFVDYFLSNAGTQNDSESLKKDTSCQESKFGGFNMLQYSTRFFFVSWLGWSWMIWRTPHGLNTYIFQPKTSRPGLVPPSPAERLGSQWTRRKPRLPAVEMKREICGGFQLAMGLPQ